jgi:LacI family transcriptional regulator
VKSRATSTDVAKLAGVSRATVSYVLNRKSGGNIRISESTRHKVWDAARQLNYHPVAAAQMLRTNRSNMLAVMVPRIENPFYPHFARAVQDAAERAGYDVIIYSTQNDRDREQKFLNTIISRGIDGLVTQTYHLSTEDLETLYSVGISVVIHCEEPTHPYMDNIVLDEARAVEELVTYLIEQGHRRIATIAGPEGTWTGRVRRAGYEAALRKHDIPVCDELIVVSRYRRGSGASAMDHLLAMDNPPTAVFAGNDFLAIGALLHAVDAGLHVPDDIAIAGFDDIPDATLVRPQLTTVRKDVETLGAVAVQLLLERLDAEETLPARRHVLPYELLIRDSA